VRGGPARSARARSLSGDRPVTALLEVHELSAGYGDNDILRGLSLHVDDGELVAVIGPNGAGKSTLLKTLAGLVSPRSGRIALRGADITGAGTRRIVASGLCYVPQEANVFPALSVWENLTIGAWTAPGTSTARARRRRALPRPRRAPAGPGRNAVGRRATDARDGDGPDGGASPAAPRRAVGGARARAPAPRLRPRSRDQR